MADNNNLPPDPSNSVNSFSRDDAANANNMAQAARSLTEELKDQLGIRSRLNETQKETLNLARQLQRSAQENTVEIGNTGNIERQIAKDQKIYLGIKRELEDAEKGILGDSKLELDMLREAAKLGDENYIRAFQSADKEVQKVALLRESLALSLAQIQQREEEAETQKDINDKMGVTGALVKGTGALMERLGMRSGIFQDAMKESAETMRKMAEETVRADAGHSRASIALKGATKVAKGFAKALSDPAVIASGMLNTFLQINKTQAETSRLTGKSAATFSNMLNTEVASLNDVMVQINETTKDIGLNAQAIFSPQTLSSMAEAVNMLGLSSKQATNLGFRADYNRLTADQFSDSILRGADSMNIAAKSAVAPGVVLNDVLNTSDDIALSLGNNPESLGKAATAARVLGLELSKVDSIAEGLLDFESSIGNELEAQLLTGKNINLAKAREFALNNDLAGLSQELAKNGANAAEFAGMNRIQQNGLAKALGMSREELAKSIVLQDKTNSLTDQQRAAVLGVQLVDLKRMDIQAKINKLVEKFLSLASPILDTMVMITDNAFVLGTILGTVVVSKIPALVEGFKSFGKAVLNGVKYLTTLRTARVADIAASSTQAAANTANTATITAQTAARQGLFATMRTGLASMGTALMGLAPAIPVMLTIAAVLASVGIAAAGVGYGFKMISDGFVNIIKSASIDKLKPLLLLGPALMSIAAGLGAVSVAGLSAIPALAALGTLAAISAPLVALGGMFQGGEDASTDGFAKLEAKLDKLISAVQAGGDVYLDGNKVGEAQVLGSYKLG